KKINEYTRYATVPICIVQAFGYVNYMKNFMISDYQSGGEYYYFAFASILTMTAGTVFLMWLGEQIDEYGIGNGISLIIMSGIVARIPEATQALILDSTTGKLKESLFTLGAASGDVS